MFYVLHEYNDGCQGQKFIILTRTSHISSHVHFLSFYYWLQNMHESAKAEVDKIMRTEAPLLFPPGQVQFKHQFLIVISHHHPSKLKLPVHVITVNLMLYIFQFLPTIS